MIRAGQPDQPGCCKKPKRRILLILACKYLYDVNDIRALIGLCLLVTSHFDQILHPWHSQLGIYYSTYSNWSLATYPFFASSKI